MNPPILRNGSRSWCEPRRHGRSGAHALWRELPGLSIRQALPGLRPIQALAIDKTGALSSVLSSGVFSG